MVRRVSHLGVTQTAKVLGALYGLLGLLFVPVFLVAAAFTPRNSGPAVGFVLALPLIYAVAGFIFTAIACALYNLVAKYVGGIEVQLEE